MRYDNTQPIGASPPNYFQVMVDVSAGSLACLEGERATNYKRVFDHCNEPMDWSVYASNTRLLDLQQGKES